ncbi:hypothetical protein [Coleofasciculus sp. H7-2]|uniref:hypothetical protein n=1 Tax=Coleofasciculus sp. H7-2 TaxID=3351545 RepID=UPI00366C5BC2
MELSRSHSPHYSAIASPWTPSYASDVTERSPKLGWCSLNPQLLIFRWKQECKPPLLLHPLGNG